MLPCVAADARQTSIARDAERQRSRLRAAQQGDAAAREQLLEDFLPLVRRVARNYSGVAALDVEELVQEGVVGLLTALERYASMRGTTTSRRITASLRTARSRKRLATRRSNSTV